MKQYKKTWNDIAELPRIGEEIILNFRNGMGTNKRYPYKVEFIVKSNRGDYKVYKVEGRQLKINGYFRNVWFELYFTNKPKGQLSWKTIN